MAKKILFVATHPQQTSGYAKIGNKITNYLCNFYDVHYFGFQNFVDTRVEDREINNKITLYDAFLLDASSNRGFGDKALVEVYEKVEPDIVFVYNDAMVCNAVYNILNSEENENKKIAKFICYLDLVFPYESKDIINSIDKKYDLIITFTNYWQEHLREIYKINENKLMTLYHGVEYNELNKNECKKKLGIEEDDYLVVNLNRNSHRKCLDICITGFINWVKNKNDKNKYKLFLGGHPLALEGYNYKAIIESECLINKLDSDEILNNLILSSTPAKMSDEDINIINNAADIIINVSSGEGFGLCNVEGMVLGKKLVCNELPLYSELLKTYPFYCKIKTERCLTNNERISGIEYITTKAEIAYKLELCKNSKEINEKTIKRLRDKFSWENVFENSKLKKNIDLL
jgi:glycosyltransferase involved in cell wall biosynthesis